MNEATRLKATGGEQKQLPTGVLLATNQQKDQTNYFGAGQEARAFLCFIDYLFFNFVEETTTIQTPWKGQ